METLSAVLGITLFVVLLYLWLFFVGMVLAAITDVLATLLLRLITAINKRFSTNL